jgi:hypothetical protein
MGSKGSRIGGLQALIVLACLPVGGLFPAAALGQSSWLGGSGTWVPVGNPPPSPNWSTAPCVPGITYGSPPCKEQGIAVAITTSGSTVTLNAGPWNGGNPATPGNITIGSTDVLEVPGGNSLIMYGSSIANSGTLEIDTGASGVAEMFLQPSTVTLTGSGALKITDNTGVYSEIGGNNGNGITSHGLINQSTISGYGGLGDGSVYWNNQGVINANSSSYALSLSLGGAPQTGQSANSGTLEATSGATLKLSSNGTNQELLNTGGTVLASGAGSVVQLGTGVAGGTLTTTSGGLIDTSAVGDLDGTTNAVTISSGSTFQVGVSQGANGYGIEGTITNNGTINVGNGSFGATLYLGSTSGDANATINGTGSVVMHNNKLNNIFADGSTSVSFTVEQPISGAGYINGDMNLVNKSTITANQPATPLTIDPSGTGSGINNTGTLEASSGANLVLQGAGGNQEMQNNGGTLLASGTGSVVQLNDGVAGGTLTTKSGGLIDSSGVDVLDGTTNPVTISSGSVFQVGIGLGANGYGIQGSIVNDGTIDVGNSSFAATLYLGSTSGAASATLSGSGSVVMANSSLSNIFADGSTPVSFTVEEPISGAGSINGDMNLVNKSTIAANQSNTLNLDPNGTGSGITNTGTLEATAGGTLNVQAAVTNTGGTILSTGSGAVVKITDGSIVGGTLSTASGGSMQTIGSPLLNGTTSAITISAGSTLTVGGSQGANLEGTIVNDGTLYVDSGPGYAIIAVGVNGGGSALTLTGTGTLTMSNNALNTIESGVSSGSSLTNESTIEGGGSFGGGGNLTLINDGTISANQPTPLVINVGGTATISNSGTLSVSAGDTLQILGSAGSFKNFNSSNGTLTGGTYNVSGTLEIGTSNSQTTNVVTNAANITLTGTSSAITNQGGKNALTTLTTNSSTGSLTLAGGQSLSVGSFTSSGKLDLAPGTLNVTGNFTNSGTIDVTVNGATAGTQFGQVTASGALNVGGALNITLAKGFVPAVGSSFRILNGASVAGEFSSVTGTAINASERFVVLYSQKHVTLYVAKGSSGNLPLADSPTNTVDFFGSGKGEPAIWRPSTGTWYVMSNGSGQNLTQVWGDPGDIPVTADYDGDGKDDFAVFRPSNGTWYTIPSDGGNTITQAYGSPGDVPVPADYDGDGKTDIAVWRPSNATWYAILSSTGQSVSEQWGATGDVPVPADYDGDGLADIAVFRPSNGTWYIIPSDNSNSPITTQFGTAGDVPVEGDYDGDGKTDVAVWRPSSSTFYVILSSTGKTVSQPWGELGDIPVVGDFNGDHKNDYAVFRPSNGTWYIDYSSGGTRILPWGETGDIPATRLVSLYQFDKHIANFDGDQKTDIGIFRPSNGTWYVIPSSTGKSVSQALGTNGDMIVPGDYDGDGKTDYAIWRPSTQTWYVILSSTGKTVTQVLGASGDIPVPGDYDGDGKTDYATWRPSTQTWYVILSSTGKEVTQPWGASGDIPVPADYDGDGKTDYAVFRPSNGTWYVILSSTGQSVSQQWGAEGDVLCRATTTATPKRTTRSSNPRPGRGTRCNRATARRSPRPSG